MAALLNAAHAMEMLQGANDAKYLHDEILQSKVQQREMIQFLVFKDDGGNLKYLTIY